MKNAHEEGLCWLKEALSHLRAATTLVAAGQWATVCFMTEQTAQVALKAYLYGRGQRFLNMDSVLELAKQCATLDPAFGTLVKAGRVLDRYYLATRYPDALPFPAVPAESFDEDEARQALAYAEQIVATVQDKLDWES